MRAIEAPQSGQMVRVRQRQYFVEDVVPPSDGDDSTLVRMSCLDDDAQGQPLEVLWEKEVDSEIIRPSPGKISLPGASMPPRSSRPICIRCSGTASHRPIPHFSSHLFARESASMPTSSSRFGKRFDCPA